MLNEKVIITLLTVDRKERYCYIKTSPFPEVETYKNEIEIELDLSNHTTKSKAHQALIHRNFLKLIN